MKNCISKMSLVFSAGALGGLINGLAVWLFGLIGIAAAAGVAVAPALTPPYLYQRMVWGGIWGALFLTPMMKGSIWLRGFIYSLGPTLVQLLVVFPYKADKGFFGLDLGAAVPLFVVFYNAVWGIVAAWWIMAGEKNE